MALRAHCQIGQLVSVLALLGAVGCESAPYAEMLEGKACTAEGACADGYVCIEGKCMRETAASAGGSSCELVGDCPGGIDGEICSVGTECSSGSCVDGVCCENPCTSVCEACTAALTGLSDGVCGPVRAGEDPDLECATDETCDGKGACSFTCGEAPTPNGGACPAECTGGCSGNTCVIACNTEGACQGATLTCPRDFACTVECGSDSACRNASVICPSRYACKMECTGDCQGATLSCDTGPCSLVCGEGDACRSAEVHCGSNACAASCDASTSVPKVDCGESCGCTTCALAKGAACTAPSQCESGFCPSDDDLCCDAACGGTCRSCTGAQTGLADGICGDVLMGTDPANECAGNNVCNGEGVCR